MRFLIISHVLHKKRDYKFYGYAPYVREMNLWLKHVDEVEVVAPFIPGAISEIDIEYQHKNLVLQAIPSIEFTSIKNTIISIIKLPEIFFKIFKACKKADHIHLRCPGNIGLLGCLVQILFPKKQKTAKYAGNWDAKSKQPISYKLQKWILRHTFLTKNMQVLVYGDWEDQTKNIKPFFTATYKNSEIEKPVERDYSNNLKFVFIGTLVSGKRPLLAIQIIEALHKQNKKVFLDIYGEGILKQELQDYINTNGLDKIVVLHGNQSKETIKSILKTAHFSILPSKSEGWPKAIAEAMFFGAIPIATPVSCVPYMLDSGNRGILIRGNLKHDSDLIIETLTDTEKLKLMRKASSEWAQQYTLETFENAIVKLLKR